jgi:hypothetical protein
MVQGKVDLFTYDGKMVIGSDEKGRFALGKKTSNAGQAVKDRQENIAAFNILFNDCPAVRDEAQTAPITKESVTKLITSYHDCLGATYTKAKSAKVKRMIDVGFFGGVYMPSLSIGPWANSKKEDAYEFKFQNASTATFGMTALIGTRSPSSIFSFHTGLAFAKGEHQGKWTLDYSEGSSSVQQVNVAKVDYSKITINAGARIAVRSNVVNPYIGVGFNYHQFVSLNDDVFVKTRINGSIEEETVSLGMDKTFFGTYAVAGVRRKIWQTKGIFAEFHYEKSYISIDSSIDLAKLSAITIRGGFLF